MTLFDPYGHGRISELRQEQLARKAKRREALGLDQHTTIASLPAAAAVRALLARVSRPGKAPSRAARSGAPALDS
jgi:hypothetical protein